VIVAGVAALLLAAAAAQADVRVKDIARIQGVRDNELFGYGIVVGLNGTGDKNTTFFTPQSIASMLQRLGISVNRAQLGLKNVAAVMATAKLPPFAKAGSQIDVVVSSLGDASTLQGGTLLLTPLQAADGQVYAVAQGALSIGGFNVQGGGGGERVQKNHPTVGRIPNGATIEREVPTTLGGNQTLAISLNHPDFTTATRLAAAVNKSLGAGRARALDAATIQVGGVPAEPSRVIELIATLETLTVQPDAVAKVVINEKTGTIIMGANVRISTVAIAHGSLSIQIKEEKQVSQPAPFSQGQTTVVPKSETTVSEEKANLVVVDGGVNIGDLVRALNALGVTPRDMISIMQAIKQVGALQAELEII
jgi:flagellar P-ring protein precursor FlgI